MTTQLFKNLVALDHEQHRNLRLKPVSARYRFAAGANALPITIAEISAASAEYPVVFATNEDGSGMPIVLLGMREDENLFVTAQGEWDSFYIPAIVRHYPFALEETPGSDKALVLIDLDYPGFDTAEGAPLFDAAGTPVPQLQQTMEGLHHFFQQEQSSVQFVSMLNRMGLLMTRKLEVTTEDGVKLALDGFGIVDEKKMLALDDASLLELARSGALGLIYAHLNSLGVLHRMMARLESRAKADGAATRQ